MIMLLSFVPVFMLSGREGKLFHPLAFTKSFAMIGVALISITVVPALIPTFIRGRLRSEEENPIVRSFIQYLQATAHLGIAPPQLGDVGVRGPVDHGSGHVSACKPIIGMGASEQAWKITFLTVFGLVTSLTVISITGKRADSLRSWGSDAGLFLACFGAARRGLGHRSLAAFADQSLLTHFNSASSTSLKKWLFWGYFAAAAGHAVRVGLRSAAAHSLANNHAR